MLKLQQTQPQPSTSTSTANASSNSRKKKNKNKATKPPAPTPAPAPMAATKSSSESEMEEGEIEEDPNVIPPQTPSPTIQHPPQQQFFHPFQQHQIPFQQHHHPQQSFMPSTPQLMAMRTEATSIISQLVSQGVSAEYLLSLGVSPDIVAMSFHELGLRLPISLAHLAPPPKPHFVHPPSLPSPALTHQRRSPNPPKSPRSSTALKSQQEPPPSQVTQDAPKEDLLTLEANTRKKLLARKAALANRNLEQAQQLQDELERTLFASFDSPTTSPPPQYNSLDLPDDESSAAKAIGHLRNVVDTSDQVVYVPSTGPFGPNVSHPHDRATPAGSAPGRPSPVLSAAHTPSGTFTPITGGGTRPGRMVAADFVFDREEDMSLVIEFSDSEEEAETDQDDGTANIVDPTPSTSASKSSSSSASKPVSAAPSPRPLPALPPSRQNSALSANATAAPSRTSTPPPPPPPVPSTSSSTTPSTSTAEEAKRRLLQSKEDDIRRMQVRIAEMEARKRRAAEAAQNKDAEIKEMMEKIQKMEEKRRIAKEREASKKADHSGSSGYSGRRGSDSDEGKYSEDGKGTRTPVASDLLVGHEESRHRGSHAGTPMPEASRQIEAAKEKVEQLESQRDVMLAEASAPLQLDVMMQEVGKGRNKEQEKELESVVVREEATKVQESDAMMVDIKETVPRAPSVDPTLVARLHLNPKPFQPYHSPFEHLALSRTIQPLPSVSDDEAALRSWVAQQRGVDATRRLCKYDTEGGSCTDKSCKSNHASGYRVDESDITSYVIATSGLGTGEKREVFAKGLALALEHVARPLTLDKARAAAFKFWQESHPTASTRTRTA